jgi:hypothetical protein
MPLQSSQLGLNPSREGSNSMTRLIGYFAQIRANGHMSKIIFLAPAADKSFVLWSCDYFVNGSGTGTIKITGPHNWQIIPGSGS